MDEKTIATIAAVLRSNTSKRRTSSRAARRGDLCPHKMVTAIPVVYYDDLVNHHGLNVAKQLFGPTSMRRFLIESKKGEMVLPYWVYKQEYLRLKATKTLGK